MSNYTLKALNSKEELNGVCKLFERNFDNEEYTAQWFLDYFNETSLNPECTIIAKEQNGNIIGACLVTEESLDEGAEQFSEKNPDLYNLLEGMRYKCISVLAVDKEYRGTQLNYQLVTSTLSKLKQAQCDWAYIQIYYELSTHDYWKRYGAIEIFDDGIEAKHYFLALTNKAKQVINKLHLSERVIRLTERDLHKIVESVLSKIL